MASAAAAATDRKMALLPCPLCLGSQALTLSDLSCAVSRFASAAVISCPVCNAATMGLDGLAAHLAAHRAEQEAEEEEERQRRIKVEAETRDGGDVFEALNLQSTPPDCEPQKGDGAR